MQSDTTIALLADVLKSLKFSAIDTAKDGKEAFEVFCEGQHDIVITGLDMSPHDGVYLVSHIRDESGASPNTKVPVILNSWLSSNLDMDRLRDAGFTDLLLSPFSVDDVSTRLAYVLENYAQHSEPPVPEVSAALDEGSDESLEHDNELVQTLLGHYIQHHETVLRKLRFAQDATLRSIKEVRDVQKELAERDNTNLHEFSRFEAMWEEIIDLFLAGGVSEDDIFKIESAIANIPEDIKTHYTKLTQQDKSFLTLIEAMNHDAYRKARDIAFKVQEAPNPMTGMTQAQYEAETSVENASFVFLPPKRQSEAKATD